MEALKKIKAKKLDLKTLKYIYKWLKSEEKEAKVQTKLFLESLDVNDAIRWSNSKHCIYWLSSDLEDLINYLQERTSQ